MRQTVSRRPPVGPAAAAALGVALGVAVGATAGHVFWAAPAPAVATARSAPREVMGDPQRLVLQPGDVGSAYTLFIESPPSDPANTHPIALYGVVLRRADEPSYLAESDVSRYASPEQAAAALKALLGVGKFGVELPIHGSIGDEAHLYAAKAQGVVVGSVLWRDRNVVAWVFVYNPYADSLPADVVDMVARGNAYDDTIGYAEIVEGHIAAG
jgi:hypothetical protein